MEKEGKALQWPVTPYLLETLYWAVVSFPVWGSCTVARLSYSSFPAEGHAGGGREDTKEKKKDDGVWYTQEDERTVRGQRERKERQNWSQVVNAVFKEAQERVSRGKTPNFHFTEENQQKMDECPWYTSGLTGSTYVNVNYKKR